ncbi:MAG: DegV family EDD domain-containing protein [Treponema sp.]|jgi:DegV family protein with EDD domain|nr:DegV family EDD domain-containing protein [Treponema sp.]
MAKIVVDSGCDISAEIVARTGVPIEVVPLTLRLGEKTFTDNGTMDTELYLSEMESSPAAAQSASPSPKQFMDAYNGGESVFAVTLSSFLSSSNNNANLGKLLCMEETGAKFIHVFDSLSASAGETLVALKIAEFIRQKISDSEIIGRINHFIGNLKTYFILEKYDIAVKTGRMDPHVAKIASMLNIKPVCAGIGGKMVMIDKVRGQKRAVKRLIEIMAAEKADFGSRTLGISHCQCFDAADAIKREILKHIPFKDAFITDTSGLCSAYTGRGGIVAAF